MRNAQSQALPYIYWVRNLRVRLSNLVFNKLPGNYDTCSNLRITALFYSTFNTDYHIMINWIWQKFFTWPNFTQSLNLLLGLSLHFLVKSSFDQELSQFNQHPPRSYLITFIVWSDCSFFTIPHVMSGHPGLSSAKILLGPVYLEPILLLMFPLSDFPSTDPYLTLQL